MLNQLMRSSRGLLIIGAVLALAAFALVLVFFQNNKSNNNATVATATVTPTFNPLAPTITPTLPPALVSQAVVAIRPVNANTKLNNLADIASYFKDEPSNSIPLGAAASVEDMGTKVLSNTILITSALKKNDTLLTTQYRLIPFSPTGSIAYAVGPGRVAMTLQLPPLQSLNLGVLVGDVVDVLLTVKQRDLDTFSFGTAGTNGAVETQQLIANARVVAVYPAGIYTLELPLQDALLVKYVRDTGGTMDLALVSAEDVRSQAQQPKTNAIVPEFLLTPAAVAKGTPQNNGVAFPFATPRPTLTPVPTLAIR